MAVPPLRVAVPSIVVPCLNVTMPVGPPGALDTNLATNLTVCPEAEGFGLEVTVAVKAQGFTICCTEAELAQSNSGACGADE
jgi:hypothetical protein